MFVYDSLTVDRSELVQVAAQVPVSVRDRLFETARRNHRSAAGEIRAALSRHLELEGSSNE
jgi:hypothetical protein